ncbi:hypothetical protein D770_11775 [Flammeovirgaceae bacterium 311]|nr:hypothetical protein D770_11775 [Flammeovirgaceae bacterium 311]
MKYQFSFLVLCLFVVYGCREEVEPIPDVVHQIELDKSFSLVPPEKARYNELNMQILGITDDRCPPGEACKQEGGEAVVILSVQTDGKSEQLTLTLNNPDVDGLHTVVLGDYRYTLERVTHTKIPFNFEVGLLVSKP